MLAHIHPSRHSLLIGSAQEMPLSHVFRLCVLSGCSPVPAMTESPFAWLGRYPAQESVVRSLDRRYPTLIAPTDSCARPQASGTLCFRSGRQSLQVVARPCWPEVLPGVISANLSPDAWSPTPALLLVHLPVTSQETSAFANLGAARQHAHIRTATSVRGSFSGLQTFAHVQASGFARHPGRSYRRASSRLGAAVASTSEHRTVCYLAVPRIC